MMRMPRFDTHTHTHKHTHTPTHTQTPTHPLTHTHTHTHTHTPRLCRPSLYYITHRCLVIMLKINEKEEGAVTLHLPIGPLKTRSGLKPVPRYEASTYRSIYYIKWVVFYFFF